MEVSGIARQVLYYMIARGLPGIINLGAMALYTRFLDARDYGRYTLLFAGVGMLNLVLFHWLGNALLRFYPAHRESPNALMSALLMGFSVVAGCVVVAGMGLVAATAPREVSHFLLLGLGLLLTQGWVHNNLELFRAKFDPSGYGWTATRVAGLSLVFGGGAVGVGAGVLVSNSIVAILLWRQNWRGTSFRLVDRDILGDTLRYGLPIAVSASLSFVLSYSDRFMIEWLLGTTQVGLYAPGYDLANYFLLVICATIGLAVTPLAINALTEGGWVAGSSQFRSNGLMFLMIAIPAAAGLLIVGEDLVNIVLGSVYREAAHQVYPFIVVGTLLQCSKFHYLDSAFFLHKAAGKLLFMAIPAALLNVLLNYFWLPEYGYVAAAWSTMFSYGLAFVMTLSYVAFVLRMPLPWAGAIRVGLATVIMVGVVLSVQQLTSASLLLDILLGGVTYGLAAWAMGLRQPGFGGR